MIFLEIGVVLFYLMLGLLGIFQWVRREHKKISEYQELTLIDKRNSTLFSFDAKMMIALCGYLLLFVFIGNNLSNPQTQIVLFIGLVGFVILSVSCYTLLTIIKLRCTLKVRKY